jgi:hypothetical protein
VIEETLQSICDIIQEDVGGRGLQTDPNSNLITAAAGDFAAACRSIARTQDPGVVIVTGFYIPHAQPPCGETDGPLGALFLSRALTALGVRAMPATDPFCIGALHAGLDACDLNDRVPLVRLKSNLEANKTFSELPFPPTHLIALERVGPSHAPSSLKGRHGSDPKVAARFLREVPAHDYDRCHTMRGRDITDYMAPAHRLFEYAKEQMPPIVTIGIGDGGNEIGMGKIPWDIIRRNIPNGGLVACRVPTDYLIVSGVSNWGAYGLAAGVSLLRGVKLPAELFDVERERELLRLMVERGPLVDGVSGQATVSVDGLPFARYAEPLRRIGELLV